MTMKPLLHRLSLAGFVGLTPLLGASAFAQEAPYPYVGLSVGQTHGTLDAAAITASQGGAGLAISGITRDQRDTGYKLFGGYQLNRHIALEAGFFHLGTLGFTSTTTPAGTLTGKSNMQGLNLDLVGTLPITDSFSAIGRIGGQYGRTRTTLAGSGAVAVINPSPSERKGGYKAGIGLQYEVSRSFFVRGEVERYRMSDAVGGHSNVDLYSVGLVFPFGRAETPAPRAMAAPMPAPMAPPPPAPVVMAEPPPAPVVAAAPVAPPPPVVPERRRVSFSAESLFGFDKSDVRPEGKAALDSFAKELDGTRYETITVEGHTDRLGTEAYNQTLSQQRADAVKSYLMSSGKIDAAKVNAVGKSESTPVTKPQDCIGNKANVKLIACLQPDRRVDIEVKGTRTAP